MSYEALRNLMLVIIVLNNLQLALVYINPPKGPRKVSAAVAAFMAGLAVFAWTTT